MPTKQKNIHTLVRVLTVFVCICSVLYNCACSIATFVDPNIMPDK